MAFYFPMAKKPSPGHRPAAKNWLSSWSVSGSDLERAASSGEHLATGTDEPITNKNRNYVQRYSPLPSALPYLPLLHQMLAFCLTKKLLYNWDLKSLTSHM